MEENTHCDICKRVASAVMLRERNGTIIQVCIVCKIIHYRKKIIGRKTPLFKNSPGKHFDDEIYPFYEKFTNGLLSKATLIDKINNLHTK